MSFYLTDHFESVNDISK